MNRLLFPAAALLLFAGCTADTSTTADAPDDAIGSTSEALTQGITVKCTATNNFGYIGTATGTLNVTSNDFPDGFLLSGSLQVNTKMYGGKDHKETIAVKGDLDVSGQYAFVNPTAAKSDISQFNFVFAPNTTSSINNAGQTIMYQTDCSHSVVNLPKGSDLTLDLPHQVKIYDRGDGTIGVQVNVINIGDQPAKAATGRVKVGSHTLTGPLYQYYGGTATAANTVNPGESGYIFAVVPGGTFARCQTYAVDLDLDHDMQKGSPNPFANDTGTAATPCVRWDKALTEFDLGYTPDPIVAYKSLADIVSSNVVARKSDGKTCNQCHYAGSGNPYSPPAGAIRPTQTIGGYTWAVGWGQLFVSQSDQVKPVYLKNIVKQWVQDGAK